MSEKKNVKEIHFRFSDSERDQKVMEILSHRSNKKEFVFNLILQAETNENIQEMKKELSETHQDVQTIYYFLREHFEKNLEELS